MCLCALERQKKKSIFLHISSTLRASGETKAGLGTAAPFLSSFSSARQSVGFFFSLLSQRFFWTGVEGHAEGHMVFGLPVRENISEFIFRLVSL